MKTLLVGHTSEATAHLTPDYPFGFRLRCERKVWIETRRGMGQRLVTMTSNPRRPGTWNKPKPGVYSAVMVMFLNSDNGHVEHDVIGSWSDEEKIQKFETEYAEALTGEYEKKTLAVLHAARRVDKKITWEVSSRPAGEVPDNKEQSQLYSKLVAQELKQEEKHPGCAGCFCNECVGAK